MKEPITTILVIPCFNEELRINEQDYLNFSHSHPDHLLLFINDGSTDNTELLLQKMIGKRMNVKLFSHKKNNGKAEAVRNGIEYALRNFQFRFIGFMDADLSTPLSECLVLEKEFESNPRLEIVMGTRVQMLGKTIKRNLFRHWFSRIIATLICKVLDEAVYDTQCGAKLFSKSAAEQLFNEKFLSSWLFDVEILARHKNIVGKEDFKFTVKEVPVNEWTEKQNSKLRYHSVFKLLLDLYKIKKHYF
ncbi:MAG: glycosyltransferase [Chitinophagaceae bacterium]|nr:glycosyltransferase [Chitinophagaceae bacterium]